MKPLKYVASVIFVKDIEASKEYYINLLDCKIEHDFGKSVTFTCGFSIWELRKTHIISEKINDTHTQSNRLELYFETEDFEAQFKKLKQANVNFLHEIHEEPWGQRTIRFFDPDKHLIEIAETLQAFVKRLWNGGMTTKEVSTKTNIPFETVKQLLKLE